MSNSFSIFDWERIFSLPLKSTKDEILFHGEKNRSVMRDDWTWMVTVHRWRKDSFVYNCIQTICLLLIPLVNLRDIQGSASREKSKCGVVSRHDERWNRQKKRGEKTRGILKLCIDCTFIHPSREEGMIMIAWNHVSSLFFFSLLSISFHTPPQVREAC